MLVLGGACSQTCGRVKVFPSFSGFHSPALLVLQERFVPFPVQFLTTAVFLSNRLNQVWNLSNFTPATRSGEKKKQTTKLVIFFFFFLAVSSISCEDAKCSPKTNTFQMFGVNLMFLKSGFNVLLSENELQTTP